MHFPVILFDFDGTLVDSVRLIIESYHHTMRVHGLPQHSDTFWVAGLGTPLRVQFRRFTCEEEKVQQLIATYREWNLAHHDAMVTAYPGAVETVRALKARGSRLGIVTSKNRHGLAKGLTLCGFDDLFDVLITSDDLEASKPSPEPVHAALALLGEAPGSTLFVGRVSHGGVPLGALLPRADRGRAPRPLAILLRGSDRSNGRGTTLALATPSIAYCVRCVRTRH
jgi:pyrophosphatase PpaX